MRQLITILFIVLITFSCTEKTRNNTKAVGNEIEKTVESAGNDVKLTKQEVIAAAERKLDRLNEQIDDTEQRLNEKSGEMKVKTQEKLKQLQASRDDLQNELKQIKNSGEDNWREATLALQRGVDRLKSNYNQFLEELKAE